MSERKCNYNCVLLVFILYFIHINKQNMNMNNDAENSMVRWPGSENRVTGEREPGSGVREDGLCGE